MLLGASGRDPKGAITVNLTTNEIWLLVSRDIGEPIRFQGLQNRTTKLSEGVIMVCRLDSGVSS